MIPYAKANAKCFWSLSDLAAFLGTDPIKTIDGHAIFLIDTPPAGPRSVLDWFYEEFADLIMYDMRQRLTGRYDYSLLNQSLLSHFLANVRPQDLGRSDSFNEACAAVEGGEKPAVSPWRTFEEELHNAIVEHSYLIGGISYKSAVMAELIGTLHPKGTDLRYCDLGGGYGLLAAEMLITEPKVERAVNVDISSSNLLLGPNCTLATLLDSDVDCNSGWVVSRITHLARLSTSSV